MGWGWDGVKACIFNWRDESPGAVGEGEEGSWSVGRCRYSCVVLYVCVGCIVVFLIHIYMAAWIALG